MDSKVDRLADAILKELTQAKEPLATKEVEERLAKARAFTDALDLPSAQSPIVPVVIGSAEAALDASARLEAEGYLVVAIRPPTVPEGTARLRIAFSAAHSDADVMRLADLVADIRREPAA